MTTLTMHDLIEHLLDTSAVEDKDGKKILNCQLLFHLQVQPIAGPLMRGPIPGTYTLAYEVKAKQHGGGEAIAMPQTMMAVDYFTAEAVQRITVAKELSSILAPPHN